MILVPLFSLGLGPPHIMLWDLPSVTDLWDRLLILVVAVLLAHPIGQLETHLGRIAVKKLIPSAREILAKFLCWVIWSGCGILSRTDRSPSICCDRTLPQTEAQKPGPIVQTFGRGTSTHLPSEQRRPLPEEKVDSRRLEASIMDLYHRVAELEHSSGSGDVRRPESERPKSPAIRDKSPSNQNLMSQFEVQLSIPNLDQPEGAA